MRVLVTGAAGFIGSHVSEQLLRRGHQVVGLDNFDPFYPPAIKERNVAALAGPGFELVRGDLCDPGAVAAAWARGPYDVVCHLAALAGVRPSIREPARYQKVNVEGTVNLLERCRADGPARFVFASSSSVYGARSQVPFSEDDPCAHPVSPYAASKRAGELLCFTYAHLHGLRITALRFFTVYGPRQRPEMAIHKFARLIEDGRPVPLFGDGASARDYTYVDDILAGTLAALERDQPGFAIYNLGGSRTTTLADLIALLERALGKRALIERHPDQPGDVPLTYADVARAGRDLGYRPAVPIEEGIDRFVRWLRSGPTRVDAGGGRGE